MGIESTLGNYYIQVAHSTFTAVVFVTDQSTWKLIAVSPNSAWPNRPTWRTGTWAPGDFGWNICYSYGTGSDAPSSNNQTQNEIFRLTDLDFPPDLSAREGFFNRQFRMGASLAGEEHIPTESTDALLRESSTSRRTATGRSSSPAPWSPPSSSG